ncbi:MAG: hypothetical protein KF732_05435 [Flavobacteriales bacterium]|nr:hypothetical protein [Flavobacteriales bacterium]
MAFFTTYTISVLVFIAVLLSNNCKAQSEFLFDNYFTIDIDEKEVSQLNFIEDSIFYFLKNGLHSEYYYDNLEVPSFAIRLTKAEGKVIVNSKPNYTPLNKYTVGIKWQSNYRSLFITSFSRNYQDRSYITEEIKKYKGHPLIVFPISSYHELFSIQQNQQIRTILETSILNKIDSNFIYLVNGTYSTIREINIDSYKIFPQAPFDFLFGFLKTNLLDKKIIAFSDELLKNKITMSSLRYDYLIDTVEYVIYDNDDHYTGNDIVLEDNIFTSILLSEKLIFQQNSKKNRNINPLFSYSYKHKSSIPLLIFDYKAIGLYLKSEKTNKEKIIWLNYNHVKKLMTDNKINFDLYEAIFTKNLFEKLKVNNYYWQDFHYEKK